MIDVAIVIPCYNEAGRLDDAALLAFVDGNAEAGLVLVDDGSRDGTEARLRALHDARPRQIAAIRLPENRGKAEAVRRGLVEALAGPASLVGYLDADLSTPLTELAGLIAPLRGSEVGVVLGSRVARLGSTIERSPVRHYLGRIFASAASLILHVAVYDTQCGAKLFRRTPALHAALEEPFVSRWAFDVELLGRLLTGTRSVPGLELHRFLEVPLLEWRDVPGSKVNVKAMIRTLRDLVRIDADLRRRRAAATGAGPPHAA